MWVSFGASHHGCFTTWQCQKLIHFLLQWLQCIYIGSCTQQAKQVCLTYVLRPHRGWSCLLSMTVQIWTRLGVLWVVEDTTLKSFGLKAYSLVEVPRQYRAYSPLCLGRLSSVPFFYSPLEPTIAIEVKGCHRYNWLHHMGPHYPLQKLRCMCQEVDSS